MDYFDKFIACAEKIGDLKPSALMALITGWYAYLYHKRDKEEKEQNLKWQEIRIKGIEANNGLTAMVEKLADTVERKLTGRKDAE